MSERGTRPQAPLGVEPAARPEPLAERQRLEVPPALALLAAWSWRLLMVVAGAVLALAAIVAGFVPLIGNELGTLGDRVDQGINEVQEFIASRPFGLSEEDLNRYLDQARQQLRENSSGITRGAVRGATLLGEVVTGLILTLFLTFVFVKDSARCATRSSCGWCVARAAPGSTCAADLPATSCPGRNLRPTTGSDPFLGNEERPKAPSDGTRPPWLQRGPSPTHRTKGDRNARLEAESTPDHHAARLGLPRVTAPAGDPASHAPMGIRRSSRCRHHPQAARHKRAADVM